MPRKQISITMTDEEQKGIIQLVDNYLGDIDDHLAYPKFIDKLCNEINNLLTFSYNSHYKFDRKENDNA